MPECDTRMPPIGPNPVAGLANSAPQFNTFINGEIAAVQAALGATPNPVRFIRELFNRLGAPVATFSGGTININVSKIEQFGASLPATQQFDPPFQSTKYAHARIYSPVFRTSPGRAISPTIRLGETTPLLRMPE